MLHIKQLEVSAGSTTLVRDVSLRIAQGEMLGLVGESGCGKSLTALSIMRLMHNTPLTITGGQILLAGNDLVASSDTELDAVRGRDVAMIFQEPMTSLNPVFRVGAQIMESLFLHRRADRRAARQRAIELLERVGVASPAATLSRYPHQLSGGQRQRVMIAIALACDPGLLIADEPTSALDVTVQAQILELLDALRREQGMAVLFITHDLGLVRLYCDQVAVMYCGQIVEYGVTHKLFARPRHPYTQALLNTIPAANPPGKPLPAIPGTVPAPTERTPGCAYSPRCSIATARCHSSMPELDTQVHAVRCWNPLS